MKGIHLALDRDDAKQLFGRRDPEALADWLANDALVRITGEHRLELPDWPVLHRLLGDGSMTADAGEYPLNQCFLGGRPLDAGEAMQVRVIRPDTVGHIADALANFPLDKLLADDSLREPAEAGRELQQLQTFFQQAFENRAAVVFCCDAGSIQ